MKRLWMLSLLTISLWLAPTVLAQSQRLRYERLNVEDGLSQGTIFSMTQDRRGFLWFGTDNGLNRYDGYTFTVYASVPFDTTSLLPEAISDIEEARDGALWIASTYQGVSRFDPATETATHYRHDPKDPNSISEGTFHAVLEARDGAIWVGTRQGLSRMDPAAPGRFTHYKHDPADSTSLSHDLVRFLFEDAAGTLWISTPNGLNRMDSAAPGRFMRYLEGPDDIEFLFSRIRRIYEDPVAPGVLWVGSRSGLVRLDTETGEVERYYPNPDHPDANMVADVTPDPTTPGVLWATVPNLGIVRFDVETGAFTPYRHDPKDPYSLPDNTTGSILTDRAGAVWIGHADGGGISRFDPTAVGFQIFLHNPNSLAEVSVWSIHEDREGGLWVGSVDGGNPSLRQIDRATNELTTWISSHGFLPPPQEDTALPSGIIYDIAEDPEGYLWLGTSYGLDRYDPATNRFTHYRHDHADSTTLSGDRVFDLLDGHDGTFWVAIVGGRGGVNRFDPATGTVTSFLNTAGSGVLSLFKDQAGMLWAGLNGDGVVQLNPTTGEITHYRHDPTDTTTITSGYVYGMVERAMEPGVLWIALSPGGLNRFDTRTGVFTHYTTEDGLPDNTINALLEDGEGYLWMSTNRGLARFDPGTEEVRTFGLEHGLQGLEFNEWASAKGRDGELFFGGVNGLNAFYPSQITENQTPPQVALTGFRLFNKPVEPGPDAPLKGALSKTEEIRLRHGEDHIDFDYVALHYKNPAQNRYAYRLEGFDRDWVDAGTDRTATYTNLPPGHYTFRVKAANSDGVWNEEGAAVRLTILPPWWRTWWAYVLYGLFFIGGVILVDRVQRRRLLEGERRRAALREAHLRTELAESQTHYLEALDQAKSRFFANISHEFRTPLTLLLGPLQEALDAEKPAERLMQQVPLMHRNAGRLLRLVGQLLDLTKLEAGSMHLHTRPLDIVAFLRELVLAFATYAERDGLTLLFDSQEEALWGSVDPDKLEKIATNLLTNAVKFTMRGGKIRVGLMATDDKAGFTLTVSDTGLGIPADELPHVFDRFYQVDSTTTREHEGTGIGLALVKELVELHQGTIAVESKRGFGTTFTVHLPVESQGVASGEVPSMTDQEPDGRSSTVALEIASLEAVASSREITSDGVRAETVKRTVLVVDDNADVRAFVCSHLEAHFQVLEAADGEAGLALTREHRPDLVISDVMMPKMDGFALCRAIKSDLALNPIPVVLLTAKADLESKLEGLGTGADDYLTKPFSAEELHVRVENLIEIRRRLRRRFSDEVVITPTEVVVSSEEAVFLEQVRTIVERHMGESSFGVEDLARAVGLGRRQLQRRLQALTDLSPAGYLRMMRLERAAQLLEQQAGRVSEVAFAVGFGSAAHFSRVFRQVFGVPPSAYPVAAEQHVTESDEDMTESDMRESSSS